MAWNNYTDAFTFKVKPEKPTLPRANTALQEKDSDPGFSSLRSNWFCLCIPYLSQDRPTRAVGKGIDWDEKLPPEIQEKWASLFQEMLSLNSITFERCLTPPDAVGLPVLCIFSDDCNEAFGSCAIARWQKSNGQYDARLISAKSRVAPLKRLTIPRLELQGAVLASRLCKIIVQESRFQFERVILFLDSEIVLALIRSEARKIKPFVSVRVGEIQTNTDPSQWKHIPGELNVADDVSRGIPVRSLAERWQHGQKFLR